MNQNESGPLFEIPTTPETSLEAYDAIKPKMGDVKNRVVLAFDVNGSMTCEELETTLQMRHQTASSAIRHLVKEGRLRDSGIRRRNMTGRAAAVWERCDITPNAEPHLNRQSIEVLLELQKFITTHIEAHGGWPAGPDLMKVLGWIARKIHNDEEKQSTEPAVKPDEGYIPHRLHDPMGFPPV